MTISFPFRSVLEKRLFGRNVSFLTNLRIERISLVRVYMDKLVVNAPSCVKVSRADRKVETCPRDRSRAVAENVVSFARLQTSFDVP